MPTYKHLPTGKRFLFIHIPRTAGRFIGENLLVNGWKIEDKDNLWKSVEGIEVAHFHRELYEKYLDVKRIPHITIVRNPVDRFISCSIFLKRMYGDDIQEAMEDPIMFSTMLQNFPLSQAMNWFRPQMDFITDETNIWKLEDGFGEDFEEFMSEVLGVEFKVEDVPYDKLDIDETKKLEKSAKLIDNITSLYRKDIEQLYPKLAAPQ
jgi:hypothetical protein